MKKLLTTILLVITSILLLTLTVEAYTIDESFRPINEPFGVGGDIIYENGKNPDGSGALNLILQIIAGALLYFAAPVAVLMIVQAGSTMIISGSSSDKVGQAKKHLIWSLVGLGIIILSYSIVRAIIRFAFLAAGD